MQNEEASLTRPQLHDLVWSKPIEQAAEVLQISVGILSRMCRENRIPLPGFRYWRQKANGRKVKVEPLRYLKGPQDVVFASSLTKRFHRKLEARKKDGWTNLEPKHPIHPYVAACRAFLEDPAEESRGLLGSKRQYRWNMSVTRDTLNKAVTVLNAILLGLEEEGFEVNAFDKEHIVISATREGQTVYFGVVEVTRLENIEVTDASGTRYQHVHYPSGRLALSIHSPRDIECRKSWTEGPGLRITTIINDFIATLYDMTLRMKKRQLEHERRRRELEEFQRKREEMQVWYEREQARERRLEDSMTKWRKSEEIRTFVRVVVEKAVEKHGKIDLRSDFGAWVSWALAYANYIDPLKGPLPVLDPKG